MFTVPLTKKMQTTLVEWYLTVARHHGVGAGPSLNDMQVGYRQSCAINVGLDSKSNIFFCPDYFEYNTKTNTCISLQS